jgi:alpha-glucosidase (family GH31 glycosyl hydrolase)
MLAHGIHLVGIMKPRIILTTPSGEMTTQAQYADEHHLWYPSEAPRMDYFSHRMARDINFADPAARSWFWKHIEPAFRSGIAGWWNDEADIDEHTHALFNNFQSMNMARAEYDGQRSVSNLRVWTLNRNYYLGADRYAYAEWSGGRRFQRQALAAHFARGRADLG